MRYHVAALSLLTCVTSPVAAQLFDFTDGVPASDVVGSINAAVVWDADGPGPAAPLCIVGGSFQLAGDKFAKFVASWNPQTDEWQAMNAPGSSATQSLYVTDANELLMGDLEYPYRWTGTSWERIGPINPTFFALPVTKIAEDARGNLFTLGAPQSVPTLFRELRRWSGTDWLREPNMPFRVNDMLRTSTGDFFVATNDADLYRQTATGWMWINLPDGLSRSWRLANRSGQLVVAMGAAQSAFLVQQFDGATWSPLVLVDGAGRSVDAMLQDVRGDFLLGGNFTTFSGGNPPANTPANARLFRVSPTGSLSAVRPPQRLNRVTNPAAITNSYVRSLAQLPDGRVLVGGDRVHGLYDGTRLNAFTGGSNDFMHGLMRLPNGDTIVTGTFDSFSAGASAGIARRTPEGWQDMGGRNLRTALVLPFAVSVLPSGDVYVRASFADAQGAPLGTFVARYLNDDWVPFTDPDGTARPLPSALPDGSLLAIDSSLGALRFDGTTWQPFAQGLLGASTSVPPVNAPDGHTYIVQRVAIGEYQLFRRNPDAWAPVGPVLPLASDPRELLFAGSIPTLHHANSVFQLINDTWHNLTSNARIIGAVTSDSIGTLYAGGQFNFPASAEQDPGTFIARWNGHRWLRVSPSLFRLASQFQPTIDDLLIAPDGSIEVAGTFTNTATMVAMGYVRAVPSTRCDSIDFNNNGVFPEDQDVIDFLRVLAGDPCETCNDLDFNNDTVFVSDDDVMAFFTALSGAPCP